MLATPTHVVITVRDEMVRAAVERQVVPIRDRRPSLCDAISFEVMRREGTGAISIVRHFLAMVFGMVAP